MIKLLSFAPILLATRSKFASEYSKKLIKVLLKKNVENFFNKMFLTKKNFWTFFYASNHLKCMKNNFHQNQSKNKIMLGELRPQALDTFELNHPSQLVIGYHRLVFLNQVNKESKTQSLKTPIHKEFLVQNRPYIND